MADKINPATKSDATVIEEIRTYAKVYDASKAAANVCNKQRSKVAKLIKAYDAGTMFIVDGKMYEYNVAYADKIDPRLWYKLWQSGEITEAQYFDALAVGKADAKDIIGADQIEYISHRVAGKDADVRQNDPPDEYVDKAGAFVVVPTKTVQGILRRVTPGTEDLRKAKKQVPHLRKIRLEKVVAK